MRDYINLTEIGTFDDLINDMPVMIWNDPKPAKVIEIYNDHSYSNLKYFNWYNTSYGSGVVGFMPDFHEDQVWIESTWMFILLK